MTGVSIRDIRKSYDGKQVVHGLNAEIPDGCFAAIVGPSGCGKSTLLRMIAGLEKITAGTLEIDGAVVNDVPPSERGIAMVFQSYALYPHMTVYDNMSFSLKIAKKSKDEIDAAVRRAAKILQLDPYLDRLPKELSGGQRQRVAIAMAVALHPELLIADEPTTALDPTIQVQVLDLLRDLRDTLGVSIMIITHDFGVAAYICDDIMVM